MGDKFEQFNDIQLMTALWYGEARNMELSPVDEIKEYMAIGSTVLNRVDSSRFPDNVRDVILQPKQFSCFNPGDPNSQIIYEFLKSPSVKQMQIKMFMEPYVHAVLFGKTRDFSNGADHYVARWFYETCNDSHWCRDMEVTAIHGGHVFLRGD